MPGIGNAIGIPFKKGGGISWSSYWDTQTNFYGKGRSGATIPDDHGNDASILLPYYYKPVGNEWLGRIDVGPALSLGATDFTFAMWVKGEGLNNPATTDFLGGKMDSNYIVTGTYGFDANGVTGKYRAFLRTNSNWILNESTITVLDLQWHFLLMEIDQTAHVLRFWVDDVKIGADVAIVGTLATITRSFGIGCGTDNATGALGSHIAKASYSDTYVFQKKLTPTEKTTLFNRGTVTGATAHWALETLRKYPEDLSGNGYQMNSAANSSDAVNIKYSIYGSRQGLNLGYELYQKVGYHDIYRPVKDDGTGFGSFPGEPTYSLSKTFAAYSDSHNFFESLIEFTGDVWDRSDTDIYNALARTGYYDAANPKRWHICELNEFILRTYFNSDYANLCFSKITNDGTFDTKLDEVFSFATNLTASQLTTIQTHINKVPTISTVTEFENATWERHPSRCATTINYNPVIQRATQVWKTQSVYYPNIMVDPLNSAQIINIYGGPQIYYTTHSIGRATAPLTNLHKWTDYASNPIIQKGAGGSWDEGVIMPGCLIWNPDDSKFWLYYAGYNAGGTDTHGGLAQSSDGLTWTKYAGNPILDPSGLETHVGDCMAVLREGSNWYMYYNYREGADVLPGIRWATSSDGLTWVKGAGELLTRNLTYAKTYIEGMRAFKLGSKYCIMYGSYNVDTDIWSASFAYSDYPTSGFVNSANNPLFSESSGGWDSSFTATVVPFLINGKWIFQYQSTDDTTGYGTALYHMGAGQLFK